MTSATSNVLRRRRRTARRRGLTLVEVLATIVMTGIVLPAAMQGISMCTAASVAARHRSEAAALGEAKLTELIATGDWQYGAAGGARGEVGAATRRHQKPVPVPVPVLVLVPA